MDLEDIRRTILLYSHIETIKYQCLVDKLAHKICSDKQFWIDKFEHDNLYLFDIGDLSVKLWICKYQKVLKVSKKTTLILTNNNIEKEIYSKAQYDNEEMNPDKIRIIINPEQICMFSNILDFGPFLDVVREYKFKHKVEHIHGHLKIVLIHDKYDLSYNIPNSGNRWDFNFHNIKIADGYNYQKINELLVKSHYYDLEIQDSNGYNCFYEGEEYDSNIYMVSRVFSYLKQKCDILKLDKTESRMIMLINDIDRNFDQPLHIKDVNVNFTFSYLIQDNLEYKLSTLLPIDLVKIINEKLDKINPSYLALDINISIYVHQCEKCCVLSHIFVHLDNETETDYEVKIEHICDHYLINEILKNSLDSKLSIVDNNDNDIYCNYHCIHRYYADEDNISRKRTIIRKTLEYLGY